MAVATVAVSSAASTSVMPWNQTYRCTLFTKEISRDNAVAENTQSASFKLDQIIRFEPGSLSIGRLEQ
jgi:hypothetical protein